jgi:SseB protein N-terminal domain/SseB protein C-terminal domain
MTDKLLELLQAAIDDPAQRPAFYRTLLESQVFVLGTAGDGGDGKTTLEAGKSVQIQHFENQEGDPVIPLFSSLELLRKTLETEEQYLALNARALFEMTAGATLVLNPNQPNAKLFVPQEVQDLLDGSLFEQLRQVTVEKDTQVLLGQPKDYPQAFIDALVSLFETLPAVRAGYLAWIAYPDPEIEPHLVIGIDVEEGVYPEVVQQSGMAAGEVMGGKLVDFFRIEQGGLSDYMLRQTEAFYRAE